MEMHAFRFVEYSAVRVVQQRERERDPAGRAARQWEQRVMKDAQARALI
jgi:hypothetical protein